MNGWHTYMTAVMAWLTVAWSLDNPRMSDFCKANMWHKACLSTDKCALLVLRGWLKPSLPLCMRTRVCVCVQYACLLVYVALQPTSFRRTLKGNRNSTNSWLSHRQSQTCLCVYVLVRKKEKRRKKKKETGKRNKGKKKQQQRLVAGITFLTPVSTDVLSRLEFERREASLYQTPFERSSMKEQQALEGERECPQ